jgi:hypothetical protein
VYLPAFAVDSYDSAGLMRSVSAAGVMTQLAAVQAALVTAGSTLGVGSYGPYKNPITHIVDSTGGGTTAPHFTPVSSFTMDLLADVQRGRKH